MWSPMSHNRALEGLSAHNAGGLSHKDTCADQALFTLGLLLPSLYSYYKLTLQFLLDPSCIWHHDSSVKKQTWQEKRCLPDFNKKKYFFFFLQRDHSKSWIVHLLFRSIDKALTHEKTVLLSLELAHSPVWESTFVFKSILLFPMNLGYYFIFFTVCLWIPSRAIDKILVNCSITVTSRFST